MSKTEVEELTEKTVAKGGVLAKMYFDMQSETGEDLTPLMTDLINNRLLKTVGVLYCVGAIDAPIKLEKEGIYSSSAIVEALFKDIGSLINVAFNFAPAGVEILKPTKEYHIKIGDLQSLMLDISNISVNYSHYILSKVLGPEELAKVERDIKSRAELGKSLLDKKGEKGK